MSAVTPNVTLIAHTPNPERYVAAAARLCYSPDDIGCTIEHLSDPAKLIRQIKSSGHFSPLEHASFTFGIEGVSRALLAQITRHRIASYSVQSQRYVGMGDFDYIVPPSVEALGEERVRLYHNQMEQISMWYDQWARLVPKEDARFVLPNAAATRMVVTMNARELLHFFQLRCCNRAQWEIRAVAWRMLELVRDIAPAIFDDAGPGCVRGHCPEGKMSCGRPYNAPQNV